MEKEKSKVFLEKMHPNESIDLSYVKEKLENFRNSIIEDVDSRLLMMIEEILSEMQQNQLKTKEFQDFAKTNSNQKPKNDLHDHWSNRRLTNEQITKSSSSSSSLTSKENRIQEAQKQQYKNPLPEKVFTSRESYLTILLEISHMKSIYHIFCIITLVFFLNSVCYDFFVEGR